MPAERYFFFSFNNHYETKESYILKLATLKLHIHPNTHTHTVVYQTFRENKMSYLLILILRSASRPFQRSRFSSQGKKKESQTLLLFTFGCSGTC